MQESKKTQEDATNIASTQDLLHQEKQQKDVVLSLFRFCFRWYKDSERFFHLLVGLPSYEKYLDYHRKYHPHCIPKTRKEFFIDSQNKRYSRDGAKKCC
ncbi:CstA-like transporter-associated (seleno)protein [Helicobacter trogontum]|uniref:YbdD/YjiX family protein n=1 Tax=Helicobacter trogontum TaxID=50960 RepID=A0A4U8SE45_9HELI|nr:YbdD/YjiX family protein [Helicobacter trogontum]